MYWVYIHTNKVTGKKYVGQTAKEPKYRWGKSGRGYVTQTKFFNAILKYGWDNFSHQVIEVDSQKEANYLERYLIAFYDTIKSGYNISPGGKNNVGGISEETRKKISEAKKDKPRSEETRKKLSEIGKGRHHSEETKRKMSEARKGIPCSEEHRLKNSITLTGRSLSEETRRKMSESHKGKPSPKKGKPQEKALYQNSETGQIREMSIQQHKNPRWIRIN